MAAASGRHEQGRRGRLALEWALRVVALAALAWALASALARSGGEGSEKLVDGAALERALPSLTTDARVDSLEVVLDTVPDATWRHWLAALQASGVAVAWRARSPMAPLAVATERSADPRGGARVRVAANAGSLVRVRDDLGLLDSTRATGSGAALSLPAASGPVTVAVGRQRARAAAPDSLRPGRVLVLGDAGWESKFTVAALQERGWAVDGRLAVAPGVSVRVGAPAALDTARYAAVVVLGTGAAAGARGLERYVRRGGGLVLAGSAAGARSVRALAPATPGPVLRPRGVRADSLDPRAALSGVTLVRPRATSVALERRGSALVAAAWRVGAGRVIALGYDDTWRWRMQGGASGPAAHRAWWSAVVDAAAYRSVIPGPPTPDADAAPLAHLIAALGPATVLPSHAAVGSPGKGPRRWLLAPILLALLAEWASRRLRGAR